MAIHVDAGEYKAAAAKLKAAPNKLRREFSKRLRDAAKPAMQEVIEEGAEPMPSGGGLQALVVAQGKITLSRAGMGIQAVLANKRTALGRLNAGKLRHPLFGNAKHWYGQSVPEGTFTEAFEKREAEIRREVAKAFDDVSRSL